MNIIVHWILVLMICVCPKGSNMEKVVPPMILQKNQKDVRMNSSVIDCSASGSNDKKYFWKLPGAHDSWMTTGSNSSYKPMSCGPHQCLVENSAGKDISNLINVIGCTPESATMEYRNVEKGGYLVLPCGHYYLSDIRKSWKLITQIDHRSISSNQKTFITANGTLIVLHVNASDAGRYICEIYDQIHEKKVDVARYKVALKENHGARTPVVVHAPNTILATEGSDVTIQCIFSELDSSKSVVWRSKKMFDIGNETIQLRKVKVEDSGNVNCSLNGLFHNVRLDVRYEPVCSEKFQSTVIARGQNATFVCMDPSSRWRESFQIRWLVDGANFTENSPSITIPGVSKSFVVTVNVSNGIESRFHSAYAVVEDSTTATTTKTTTTSMTTTTTTTTSVAIPTTPSASYQKTSSPSNEETTRPSSIPYVFSSLHIPTTTASSPTEFPIVPVAVGAVIVVVVIAVFVMVIVLVVRKMSSKNKKQEQNTNDLALVLANNHNNNDGNNPAAMNAAPQPHGQGQAGDREPIARPGRNHMPDDDSMSLRSSDSGFSDPTNEPLLLKSNEQLNGENKSKSDSEHTLPDRHLDLPMAVC